MSEVDGVRLLGFWRACLPMPWAGPGSFGHPGSGNRSLRLRHESLVIPHRRAASVETNAAAVAACLR
jgi:hypothetical protein